MCGVRATGAILPLPPKMAATAGGVKAIAFDGEAGGLAFYTTRDAAQLSWDPPQGCTTTGPPNGTVTCDAAKMNAGRPTRDKVTGPADKRLGAGFGDPTAAYLNETDGKLYGVFAASEQAQVNDTWRNPGRYAAIMYRTKTDADYREWEFVSEVWRAPPTQTSKRMGFTNCPDFFRLADGRFVFAYLSHSTQYGGTRILSFVGTCDEFFNCEWPDSGDSGR